eukprot:SAG11_NODE_19728_length_460_cov_0.761773_1_plen_131_part_01
MRCSGYTRRWTRSSPPFVRAQRKCYELCARDRENTKFESTRSHFGACASGACADLESIDNAKNTAYVDLKLSEARRVRDNVLTATGRRLAIYTFTWMDYYSGEVYPYTVHLDAADLATSFARPSSVWGAQG